MFTCLAWNNLGSESSCAELRVIQLAPTFAKHPVMPVEGMVGGTAVMECQPEGAPGMTTSWLHGTTALSPGTSTLDPQTGSATVRFAILSIMSTTVIYLGFQQLDNLRIFRMKYNLSYLLTKG